MENCTVTTCGKETIRLVQACNDANCLYIEAANTSAEISTENIERKVVHILPNEEIQLKLLQVIKRDSTIIILYMK